MCGCSSFFATDWEMEKISVVPREIKLNTTLVSNANVTYNENNSPIVNVYLSEKSLCSYREYDKYLYYKRLFWAFKIKKEEKEVGFRTIVEKECSTPLGDFESISLKISSKMIVLPVANKSRGLYSLPFENMQVDLLMNLSIDNKTKFHIELPSGKHTFTRIDGLIEPISLEKCISLSEEVHCKTYLAYCKNCKEKKRIRGMLADLDFDKIMSKGFRYLCRSIYSLKEIEKYITKCKEQEIYCEKIEDAEKMALSIKSYYEKMEQNISIGKLTYENYSENWEVPSGWAGTDFIDRHTAYSPCLRIIIPVKNRSKSKVGIRINLLIDYPLPRTHTIDKAINWTLHPGLNYVSYEKDISFSGYPKSIILKNYEITSICE